MGDAHGSVTYSVTIDKLGLPPIDLLYVLDDAMTAELGARLALATRSRFGTEHPGATIDVVTVQVLSASAPPGTRPVSHLAPLVSELRQLLANARAATRRDLVAPNTLHSLSPEDRDGIDLDELAARVNSVRVDFEATLAALGTLTGLDAGSVEGRLLDAARFGLGEAVPLPGADLEALVARPRGPGRLWKRDARRLRPNGLRQIRRRGMQLHFYVRPRVCCWRIAPVGPARATRPESCVRSTPRRCAVARTGRRLALSGLDRAGERRPPLAHACDRRGNLRESSGPAGLSVAGGSSGLVGGIGFSRSGSRSRLSLDRDADAWALRSGTPMAALVVDEWHELVPNDTETTGVAFHYDAPNAEPPQTVLLAVSARRRELGGNWSWDELAGCVDQALQLAKVRAVGPDQLRHTLLDALLPATVAAETVTPATISTSFLANMSDRIANAQMNIWSRL